MKKSIRSDKRRREAFLANIDARRLDARGIPQGRTGYGSSVRARNRCIETGHGRSVIGDFKVSRMVLHQRGLKEGWVTKSSW
jgi:ribosomal protein S14